MTVQRYGKVTTNADLQSSCFFGEIVLARGKNRRDEFVSSRVDTRFVFLVLSLCLLHFCYDKIGVS